MRILLVLLMMLVTGGCSTRSGPELHEPQEGRLPALPGPGKGDFILPPRSPSATYQTLNYSGWFPMDSHGPVVPFGEAASFELPASAIDWALYDMNNGGCPSSILNVEIEFSSGQAWLLLADYEKGVWEPHGPYTADPPFLDVSAAKYYSPEGRQYFVVVRHDESQFKVHGYAVTIAVPDGAGTFTALGVGFCDSLDLVELDGRPAIMYYDAAAAAVVFAHASSAEPFGPLDWTASTIAETPSARSIAAAVYQGKPCVALQSDGATWIAAAGVPEPTGAGDWSLQALPAGTGDCHLAVINGRLTVAYYESDLSDADEDDALGYMRLAYPTTGDPSGDWTSYRLAASDHLNSQPWLAERDGKPTVAWAMIESGAIAYGGSIVAGPTAAVHWNFHELSAFAGEREVRLLSQNDRSWLAFGGLGTINLWEAWEPLPTDVSGWNEYTYFDVNQSPFDFIDAADRGISAYVRQADATFDELVLRRELRPLTTLPWIHDESLVTVLDLTLHDYRDLSLAMVAGQPAVAAAYSASEGSILYYRCFFD